LQLRSALLLTVVSLLLPGLPIGAITIQFGEEAGLNAQGQGEHLYNFFGWGHTGTEQGRLARRMDPTASLVIPWAFQLDHELEVLVSMCGCGSTEPVTLSINGEAHRVPLSNEWQIYSFAASADQSQLYGQSLYLEWQSDATPRPLVHEIIVWHGERFAGWRPLWPVLLWGLLLLPLWALATARTLPVVNPQSADHWEHIWLAALLGSLLLSRAFYEPQLLGWATLVTLGSLLTAALNWLVPNVWRRLALWAMALWLLAVPQLLGTWILDDAFISFRYARNLVEGYGLTFNPGGEIVEGYTNFLWTLLMAGVLALGLEPVATAQALCTGLALVLLLLTYRLAVAWWAGRWWALLPPLLLVLNPAFLLYTARGSGMETALVTTLALAAMWLLWRAQNMRGGLLAGLVCALVVMTRPDGALVPLAGGLLLLVQAARPTQRAHALPALIGLVAGFLLLYGPYFAWRYSYYGYLLPNTFYAKTGATTAQVWRGFFYTRDFFLSLGLRSLLLLLGLSLGGLAWALWQQHRRSTEASAAPDDTPALHIGPAPLLWLFLLLTCLYVTLVGGDQFPLGRFFVPILPPLMLLVTHGLVQAGALGGALAQRWPRARYAPPALAGLALALLVWVNVSQLPRLDSRDPAGRIWGENSVALKNREIGWWFYRNTPPDTQIATAIAGALPYYAQRPTIDTLGLNNTHIAHLEIATMGQGIAGAEKTDLAYVLDQQPDYIPFSTSGSYQELPRFQQMYERITVRGPEGSEIILYRRRAAGEQAE
jgi:hypothetical protein